MGFASKEVRIACLSCQDDMINETGGNSSLWKKTLVQKDVMKSFGSEQFPSATFFVVTWPWRGRKMVAWASMLDPSRPLEWGYNPTQFLEMTTEDRPLAWVAKFRREEKPCQAMETMKVMHCHDDGGANAASPWVVVEIQIPEPWKLFLLYQMAESVSLSAFLLALLKGLEWLVMVTCWWERFCCSRIWKFMMGSKDDEKKKMHLFIFFSFLRSLSTTKKKGEEATQSCFLLCVVVLLLWSYQQQLRPLLRRQRTRTLFRLLSTFQFDNEQQRTQTTADE